MTSWPKDTQAARNKFYGDPGKDEIASQLVAVVPPFKMYYDKKPIKSISFHKKAAPALLAALNEIWDYCEHDQRKVDASGASKYFGAYNHRKVRGSATKWSNHAYGTAIDLNALENALGQTGNMPAFIVDAFTRQGAMWGGWYKSRPDWMHFEFVDNGGHQPRSSRPVYPKVNRIADIPEEAPDNGVQPVEFDDESEVTEPAYDPVPQVTPASNAPLNIQPIKGRYNLSVEVLQKKLISLNYHEVGDADGFWGGKTIAGVSAFLTDRGVSPDGLMNADGWNSSSASKVVSDEISKALSEQWSRPIAPKRANATAAEVAQKVPAVKQAWYQKLGAWLLGIPATIAAGFRGIFGENADLGSTLNTVKDFFTGLPLEVYLVAAALGALALWFSGKTTESTAVDAYRRGEIN